MKCFGNLRGDGVRYEVIRRTFAVGLSYRFDSNICRRTEGGQLALFDEAVDLAVGIIDPQTTAR